MSTLTVIGHSDLISDFRDDFRYLTIPAPDAQISMEQMKATRPLLVIASLCPFDYHSGSNRVLSASEAWGRWVSFRSAAEASPSFQLVFEPNEIVGDAEQIQLLLHLEGADVITKPADLEQFVLLGGRALALTWNSNNQYAGGAFSDGRLTPLGKELLGEMKRLGLLLDISHLNEESFWDVMNEYDGPVFASHSNARELADSPRNLTKRQLHALRERQAWVGATFARSHLTSKEIATIDDVIAHLDYLRTELGAGLVGLGTDFGGILSAPPKGLESLGSLPNLITRLEQRSWPQEDIAGLSGNNFLSFWRRSQFAR